MAHTFEVVSVTKNDDQLTFNVNVDGTPVQFCAWFSHVKPLIPADRRTYVAQQALAALAALQPPVVVDLTAALGGTFTQ